MSDESTWDGVERRSGNRRRKEDDIHPMRWRLLAVWIVIFTIIVGWAVGTARNLGEANKQRIVEIQKSRLDSCKQNFQSFHAVFDPFFPPPEKRTAKQKKQLAKFNRIIDEKIKHCRAQVTPPPITTNPKKGNS